MNQNTDKIIKSLAAFGGAAAIGVVATNGHQVKAATVSQSQVQLTSAAQEIQQAKQTAADQENQMAASNVAADQADKQVEAQKLSDLKSATQAQIDQENTALSQVTNQVNNQASQAIASENQNYLSSVDAAQSAASEAINSAQAAANKLNQADTSAAIASAQDKYNQSAAAVDSQAESQKSAAAADRQVAVNQLSDAAKSTEEQAVNDHQQKISDQQAASQKLIDQAQAAVDQAKKGTINETQPVTPITNFDHLSDGGKRQVQITKQEANVPDYINVINTFGKLTGSLNASDGHDYSYFTADANTAKVSSEGQLPLDFKPGIILYDPDNDHSEKIGDTLTEAQAHKLSELATYWTNQLRHQWVTDGNLVHIVYDNKDETPSSIQDLTTNDQEQKIADQIGHDREAVNYGYTHTGYDAGVKRSGEYYKDIVKSISANSPAGSYVAGSTVENMYQVEGKTMLQAEVSLYNRLQVMYYGEAVANGSHLTAPQNTHLRNAVDPAMFAMATGFQKIGDHKWIFVNEYVGSRDLLGNHTDMTAVNAKVQGETIKSTVADDIKSQRGDGQTVVDQNAVAQAEQNLVNVQKTEAAKLEKLKSQDPVVDIKAKLAIDLKKADADYQAKLDEITKHTNDQKQALKNKLDAEIKQIKAGQKVDPQADIDQINAKLADKLNQLKADHEAKINQIKADAQKQVNDAQAKHDEAVKKITANYQAELNLLKSQTQAKIDQRAKALADLKATNAQKIADLEKQANDHQSGDIVINVPGSNTPASQTPSNETPATSDQPADSANIPSSEAPADSSQASSTADRPSSETQASQTPVKSDTLATNDQSASSVNTPSSDVAADSSRASSAANSSETLTSQTPATSDQPTSSANSTVSDAEIPASSASSAVSDSAASSEISEPNTSSTKDDSRAAAQAATSQSQAVKAEPAVNGEAVAQPAAHQVVITLPEQKTGNHHTAEAQPSDDTKKLPQTGDDSDVQGILTGALGILLGVFVIKRKKRA